MPLKERGYCTELLKKIYNSNDMESKKDYEKLLDTLNGITDNL